jgi:hypothetical protein
MLLSVKSVSNAIHPSEVVATVDTINGEVSLVLDRMDVVGNAIKIGRPIANGGDTVLVELPRETMTGLWRVRVPKESVKPAA